MNKNPNLVNCLEKLIQLKNESEFVINLLVVINGDEVVSDFGNQVSVIYEERRGYSTARNAALVNLPRENNLIFIDDDEIPSKYWLREIIDAHFHYPNDVIVGPVYSANSYNIEKKSYRDRFKKLYEDRPDGVLVDQGATANMLIPLNVISNSDIYFDTDFDHSGSEDTDFCFRLRHRGVKIRYAKKASLLEIEDLSRFDPNYLKRRFIRDVANYSVVIRRNSQLRQIIIRGIKLLTRIAYHAIVLIINRKDLYKLHAYSNSLYSLVTGKINH
jgi:GT2 family glycosyltransferase